MANTKSKGAVSPTPKEKEEKELFILNRIRAGLSRIEIQRQYAENYDCTVRNARNWYNDVCDNIWDYDESRQEKRRIKMMIVEMYHSQLTSAQSDLASLSQEISRVTAIIERRRENTQFLSDFEQGLITARNEEINRIRFELEMLPEVPLSLKGNLLELKSRMRERLFKMITELAKVQGCYGSDTSWLNAVNTLLDLELIDGEMASKILAQVDLMNGKSPRKIEQDTESD